MSGLGPQLRTESSARRSLSNVALCADLLSVSKRSNTIKTTMSFRVTSCLSAWSFSFLLCKRVQPQLASSSFFRLAYLLQNTSWGLLTSANDDPLLFGCLGANIPRLLGFILSLLGTTSSSCQPCTRSDIETAAPNKEHATSRRDGSVFSPTSESRWRPLSARFQQVTRAFWRLALHRQGCKRGKSCSMENPVDYHRSALSTTRADQQAMFFSSWYLQLSHRL